MRETLMRKAQIFTRTHTLTHSY